MTDFSEYIKRAYEVASYSPDLSTQNGAVLLRYRWSSYCVIGEGCNEFPKGVNEAHWSGPKEAKYDRVVHAEVAAILSAAKTGSYVSGTVLVCPWAACSNCAKHIAYSGVSTLVRHKFSNNGVTTGNHWYQDCVTGDEIMKEAGVEIIEIDPVPHNIKLRRNGNLWTPST